jgi:hypothetical protein
LAELTVADFDDLSTVTAANERQSTASSGKLVVRPFDSNNIDRFATSSVSSTTAPGSGPKPVKKGTPLIKSDLPVIRR